MKNIMILAAISAIAFTAPANAADVGVSVTIGQPGFYGRIDIGDYPYPQPRVIYQQPRIVERVYDEREPIYLRVPPGHARNWPRFCHRYNACGERVYFVQDSWYENEYVPQYREHHGDHREYDNDRRDEHRDDYYDDHRDEDHGNSGRGKKKGHGQNR